MEDSAHTKEMEQPPVTLTWDIHYTCNYRCPYCWFHGKWQETALQQRHYPLQQVLDAWTAVYRQKGRARILMNGGEPFIYPRFEELIRELARMHDVQITSNLSVDIGPFLKAIDSQISVCGSFHPTFADFDRFLSNVLMLRERKMSPPVVNYVAYPPQIPLIPYFRERFEAKGLHLWVMTFWGEYNGKRYPDSYTEEEKKVIYPILAGRGGEDFQLEPRQVKGKLCRAGQSYGVIKADGTALGCGGGADKAVKLGNFFAPGFKLNEKPLPCQSESCKCNEWAELLVREPAGEGDG